MKNKRAGQHIQPFCYFDRIRHTVSVTLESTETNEKGDRMSTNFFQMSNEIFRYRLKPNKLAVYCYLVSCTEDKSTRLDMGQAERKSDNVGLCTRRNPAIPGRSPDPLLNGGFHEPEQGQAHYFPGFSGTV